MRFLPLLSLLLASLALAACSAEPEPAVETEQDQAEVSSDADAGRSADRTAAPVLATLTRADFEQASLSGELGCTFTREMGSEALFAASGNVSDEAGADGIAKIDGAIREFTMEGSGGFSAMASGARFTSAQGLSLAVEVTGEQPVEETPQIAMESPAYEAVLTLSRGDQQAIVEGIYECGP